VGSRRYVTTVALPALAAILAVGGAAAHAGSRAEQLTASPSVRQVQHASRTHLDVRLTSSRLLVRLSATTSHRVAFVLDGHRVGVRRTPPYRISLSRSRLTRLGRHRVVARDAHSGIRLAARVLSLSSRAVGKQPTVVITSGPAATTTSTSVSVGWTSSLATTTTCSVDQGTPASCTSPSSLTVSTGAHTFTVTASNRWGSAAASTAFTVIAAPVPVPPGGGSGGGGGGGGGGSAPQVAAPVPPTSYSVPAGATLVRSSAELASALQSTNRDIVLADGVYAGSSPFVDNGGNRLFAQNLGGAVLQAGLVVGGNAGATGAIVRGLSFDVSDPGRTLGGGELHIWGPAGANTQVLDCVFNGRSVVPVGILDYNPQGLHIERVQLSNFTDEGIRASDNVAASYGASVSRLDVIQDVSIDGVSRSAPGTSNGTAEAGLWVGEPVQNGVHRIKVRNVAWSGIETVNNAWDTSFTDLDIDMSGARQAQGVGVYLEHYSRNLTFDRFVMTGVRVGYNAEWADPAYGSVAAAHFVTIRNGVIDSSGSTLPGNQAGIYLDEGSESTTVTSVTFRNQNWAGIGAYKNIGTNVFTQLSQQMKASAVTLATSHI
jgi:hypothetical protein